MYWDRVSAGLLGLVGGERSAVSSAPDLSRASVGRPLMTQFGLGSRWRSENEFKRFSLSFCCILLGLRAPQHLGGG